MIELLLPELETYGLLLKTDAKLPSAAAIIVGEPIRGSWWAHPKSHQIFHALNALAAHPDVLLAKLISGKDTFIHRTLWPAFLAVATSREPWQVKGLDAKSKALLKQIDERGKVETTGPAARALQKALLVRADEVHTGVGSHAKILQSWKRWMTESSVEHPAITTAEARESLEKVVAHLNARYAGRATLPWVQSCQNDL